MDLRQLRYFVCMVQSGSLAAAARQLHLAQPALSHHLKNLEQEFGTRLLERGPKGMLPTAKGDLLYQHAVALLRQASKIESVMLRGAPTDGIVSLGLPKTVARLLAYPIFARLKRCCPAIQLHISDGYSSELGRAVAENRLDLAIIVEPGPSSGTRTMSLLAEEMVVVVPANPVTWLPNERELTVAEVSRLPILMTTRRERMLGLMSTIQAANPIELAIQGHIDDLDSLLQAVQDGLGVTVLPWSAVQGAVDNGRVAVRAIRPNRVTRQLLLVWGDRAYMEPSARSVAHEICGLCQEMADRGTWKGIELAEFDVSELQ